jgi:hypothetical protein
MNFIPKRIADKISNERNLTVMRLTTGEYLASLSTPHFSETGNTPDEAIYNLNQELMTHDEN